MISAVQVPTEGACQWDVGVQVGAWEEMKREPERKG